MNDMEVGIVGCRGSVLGLSHPHPPHSFGIVSMLTGIVKRDGMTGLFRGLGPTLATVPTFWGFYFPAYEASKYRISSFLNGTDLLPLSSQIHQPVTHLIAAVSAGAFADTLTNPMWVVRTRMQTGESGRRAKG